jgi:hypothetical protein
MISNVSLDASFVSEHVRVHALTRLQRVDLTQRLEHHGQGRAIFGPQFEGQPSVAHGSMIHVLADSTGIAAIR